MLAGRLMVRIRLVPLFETEADYTPPFRNDFEMTAILCSHASA